MAERIPFLANWRQNIIYIGFVVIFAVFAVTLADKGFLNPTNLLNIIRQTAMIAVMAVAMTFVLASGEIDLSIGAVAGLATVTVAMAGEPPGVPVSTPPLAVPPLSWMAVSVTTRVLAVLGAWLVLL